MEEVKLLVAPIPPKNVILASLAEQITQKKAAHKEAAKLPQYMPIKE